MALTYTTIAIVTVGTTRRNLVVTIVDENNQVVSLSATLANHKLQGRSLDLPSKTIDYAATAVDGPAGIITFGNIGALVTQAELTAATKDNANFRLKVKYTDIAALVDYTLAFGLTWDEGPLESA